jgi:DNA-nicking Smr family endonuclease
MARRRGLSPEDRRIWEQVAASATPLRPAPPRAPDPVVPEPPQAIRRVDPPRIAVRAPGPGLERGHASMDRRRFERMRRGRLEPEARLDLHGLTSERAHAALTAFVLAAYARDLRLVLVITGKGRADDDAPRRHGILRHSLPHWLAAPPLVGLILEVAPAHHTHGGTGAFYVYLRRRR